MKSYTSILLLFFSFQIGFTQRKITFDIIKSNRWTNRELKEKYSNKTDSLFFEDNLFEVRRTNSGEWGASLWFKSKKNGIEYSCTASSSFPIIVNKLKNKYYISTIEHSLFYASEVFEIGAPERMEIFKLPEPRNTIYLYEEEEGVDDETKNYKLDSIILDESIPRYYDEDFESKSKVGTKMIAREDDVRIITSFVCKNQLFHIIIHNNVVTIDFIENKLFKTVYHLMQDKSYNYTVLSTDNKETIVLFTNEYTEGNIVIKKNKVYVSIY